MSNLVSTTPRLLRSAALSLLAASACVDADPAASTPEFGAEEPESTIVDPPLQAALAEKPESAIVDPRLQEALASGPADEEIELDLRVAVPSFQAPELPPMIATIEVADRSPIYTLDGRTADEAEMRARAEADRRAIDASLARQFDARRRLVAAAIADSGVEDAVRERGDTWFRVRLPRERARGLLRALDGRLQWARPAEKVPEVVALRNHLHESNGDNNPNNDGDDGALERIGVVDFGHDYGMHGQGIGIWHNEGYAPYPRTELGDADIRYLTNAHWQPIRNGGLCRYDDECCSGDCASFLGTNICVGTGCTCGYNQDGTCGAVRGNEHATMMALLAHETAPEATIYHTATTYGDCMINASIDSQTSPPVYVGTQSWTFTVGLDDPDYNAFGTCMGEWDDYITASRIAHFSASGNEWAQYVHTPGRAYNVIAVGNYDHIVDSMTVESTFADPSTGVEKPEIIAPGTNITAAPNLTASGTSISAPITAGFVADMMSGSAFFLNQPQAVKAYLIAGAHNAASTAGFENGGEMDGAGRIDYLDTFFYRWGKVWNGNNGDFFDANEKIVETRTLTAGKHYTIAIAWLASGAWAHLQTFLGGAPLSQKLKLTVSRAGVGTWTRYIANNNFQLLDFTVPANGGGTWTITIERMYNSGMGGVDLALTVGEHSD